MKQCSKCDQWKPLTGFHTQTASSSGKRAACKVCLNERRRERWRNNVNGCRDRQADSYAARRDVLVVVFRADSLRRKFNLSMEQYLLLHDEQGGLCALCGEPETKMHHKSGSVMSLSVDHDHACCPGIKTCGRCVRGLLCYTCNLLLGKVEARPRLAARFADYLQRRPFDPGRPAPIRE